MKGLALTYDDIQLVPDFSAVTSRKNIYLNTLVSRNHRIDIPLIASPMDTVCGFEMAKKMKRVSADQTRCFVEKIVFNNILLPRLLDVDT